MSGPAVIIESLSMRRGGTAVLDLPSLTVPSGQTTLIAGSNGAGKTTLLRALVGFERPAGHLEVLGQTWGAMAPAEALSLRRRIGFAMQRPYPLDTTVAGNVEYPLKARGIPREQARSRSAATLRRLGIEHLAARRATRLSIGELMRMSIARAIVATPELLLLDEPAANIDEAGTGLLVDLVADEAARGATVLVATQRPDVFGSSANHTFTLERGRVVETDGREA